MTGRRKGAARHSYLQQGRVEPEREEELVGAGPDLWSGVVTHSQNRVLGACQGKLTRHEKPAH